ncbi:MAG: lipopolysaccharide biosynthesis protein RfbH [Erysipelotrichaceae bacterium]
MKKQEILDLVRDYYHSNFKNDKAFEPGDRISYAGRVFDEEEMVNLVDSALDFWLTSGKYCDQFEKKLANYLNVKYCAFVNSGSSANLLAFMALTSPLLKERQIKRGDEVISVAAGFPTTITPIIQYGAIPVFVDVELDTYNIDCNLLEEAYSSKTKAVMIAHTLGNPFNIERVKAFCEKYNLWLIEDNCDALGSQYTLKGETKLTGTFGDIATSSFYPPHHLTTGEGGAVYTNNPLLSKIVLSLRDWGRDCVCNSGQDNLCKSRFTKQYGQLPLGYDHKYVYSHFGYNLKATEMQAAIGVAQLDKVDEFTQKRRKHHAYLSEKLVCLKDYLVLPEPQENSNPSWFGFLITVKDNVDRNDLIKYIEEHNIQTRMLFASNIILHPCFDEIRDTDAYRVVGDLSNTNTILNNTFWIGVAQIMTQNKLDYMAKVICAYFVDRS